jgi:hypothetical protein
MTFLEFAASVIRSLAWPVAIVALVLILQSPVKKLLLSLTRFKYRDVEIDFAREVAQLESRAKAIDLKPRFRVRAADEKTKDPAHILRDATQLVDEFPIPAVALAWTAVEHELMGAVYRLAISADPPSESSASKSISILQESEYLDKEAYSFLTRMRDLRNMVVHSHGPGTRITSDDAREFVAIADAMVERLASLERK